MLDRPLSARAGLALLVVSLVGLGGLVSFLLGEGSPPPGAKAMPPPRGTVSDTEAGEYVGDRACALCHPAVFALHQHSRHALTLHAMLPGQLPCPMPEHLRFSDGATGIEYAVERQHDRYSFQVLGPGEPQAQPIAYAFGSGKAGITFVGLAGDGAIRELRMSYFPSRHRWEVTPGQRAAGADPLGALHERRLAQRCFGCHATVILASRVLPEPKFMGVGCEACHGPGRRHLEAVRRGEPNPRIDNPGRWDGKRVNELCGRCHRTEQDLDPLDSFSQSQTQRFQPIGLARSACFRASAGRLTCVTCHDAHANASRSPAQYEAVCRSCHNGGMGIQGFGRSGVQPLGGTDRPDRRTPNSESTLPSGGTRTPERPNAVCPINSRSGCIACHMPDREVVRGISMADHWIRVFPSSAGRALRP